MPEKFAIAARDHGACIADQRLDGMARGRGLPLAAFERTGSENDLANLPSGRAGAMTVEGLQHPAHACPLLAGQACVGRNRTTMQSGKKPICGFEAIEPIHTERDDRCCGCDAIVNELKMLAVAEMKQQISVAVFSHRNHGIDHRRRIDWR